MAPEYEAVNAHGLPIVDEPVPHVDWNELRSAFGKDKYAEFEEWMKGQSCLAGGAYAWDVERFLSKGKSE